MADVIIRGMKIPKDCPMCKLAHFNKFDEFTGCDSVPGKRYVPHSDYQFWNSAERPKWCPLVPLPEGHGRLIDADSFKADCLAATNDAKPDFVRHEDWLKACAVTMSFCRDIDERPTIVPAEGGAENG